MFTGVLLAIYIAVAYPVYLSNTFYLAELIFLQLLIAVLWNYRERFLPLLVVAFLWAGTALPWQGVWTIGRWYVLAVGALAGFVIYMRDRSHSFSSFHLVAGFCVLAALVSAIVSSYGSVALLKAASLLLLFLYGASGARVAVMGREAKFVAGLLLGCELLIYLTTLSYFVFRLELFDNSNSLGAVMGVAATPIMLWGTMVAEQTTLRHRRTFALMLALVLVLGSFSRAGIAAAAVSFILLCAGLRRYRLLVQGLGASVLVAIMIVSIQPLRLGSIDGDSDAHSLADIFVYKGHRDIGVLGSRKSAWDRTSDVIREHPWFGSGFGTSITRAEVADQGWVFESTSSATREHGNSYLAITEWVGLLGVGPFATLILILIGKVYRVLAWMRRTGNAFSTAIPLAVVVAAGLVHAVFEDWLFAVGYYLCVFFWALAFVLVDVVPAAAPALIRSPAPKAPSRGAERAQAVVSSR
jgi:O-antigen ligase